MNKVRMLVATLVLVSLTIVSSFAEDSKIQIKNDVFTFSAGEGYIDISGKTEKDIKILLETPDSERIWFDPVISEAGLLNRIWLADGKGNYNISILEHLHDNIYGYLKTAKISNELDLDKNLLPSNYINSDNPEIITLAAQITLGSSTDLEKSQKIYDWVTTNIRYDLRKYSKMQKNDFSDPFGSLSALRTKKGVCFDYATLYAALARASGIKCKVITGQYKTKTWSMYHAWNEVYDSKTSRWISLDSTLGFVYKKNNFDNIDTTKTYIASAESN